MYKPKSKSVIIRSSNTRALQNAHKNNLMTVPFTVIGYGYGYGYGYAGFSVDFPRDCPMECPQDCPLDCPQD